jgi:aminopeptidase N
MFRRGRARRAGAALAAALAVALATAAGAGAGAVGSSGAGDPLFPKAGNGGYEVDTYDIDLDYSPRAERLRAKLTLSATSTQRLRRFDLDLRGLEVKELEVDGSKAHFKRAGQELIISPREPLAADTSFEVTVRYSGRPGPVHDPDGSLDGWVPTADGAHVVGEPQGSPTWFPCNDHPTDKATYRFEVTVPKGTTAVANGNLVDRSSHGGRTTFEWSEDEPMATYLATATIGKFAVTRADLSLNARAVPAYVAVDPKEAPGVPVGEIGDILGFFAGYFGPYPFGAAGAIIDHAPKVGYALETQTRPSFDSNPDDVLLAHELAHQWFGDSVSLERWRDIWLNEGFATWAEWWWREHAGGQSVAETFEHLYSTPRRDDRFWNPPPADPGSAKRLFDGTIYDRGGMALEALRETVGDGVFFDILETWATEHFGESARTGDFIALAEEKSGMDLGPFFNDWLFQRGKPAAPSMASALLEADFAAARLH